MLHRNFVVLFLV